MKIMPAHLRSIFASIKRYGFFSGVLLALGPTPTPPCSSDMTMTELGCLPKDPVLFISSFYTIGLGLIGGVALLFIIVGGYTLLTSQGNPTRVALGKSYIFYSLAGLFLAVVGYFFLEVVVVDILALPGFGR